MKYDLKYSHPCKGLITVTKNADDWLCIESCTATDQILQALLNEIKELQASADLAWLEAEIWKDRYRAIA